MTSIYELNKLKKKTLTLYFVVNHTSLNVFLLKTVDTDLFLELNLIGWINIKRKQDSIANQLVVQSNLKYR